MRRTPATPTRIVAAGVLLALGVTSSAAASVHGTQAAGEVSPAADANIRGSVTERIGRQSNRSGASTPEAAVRSVLNYDRPATYESALAADIFVPTRDGYRLTCDLLRPAAADGSPAAGRFPGIVVDYFAYGRKSVSSGQMADYFARRGYNVLACNTRGSNGAGYASPSLGGPELLNPWSPKEQKDNYDLIEWFAAQPWSTGKIGQTGTSYGAITTLMVAGRQNPPSLKAIMPVYGVTDIYRHFAYPGGVRTFGDARGIFPSMCGYVCGDATVAERLETEWREHPTYDDYWRKRSFDVRDIRVPTLAVAGTKDFFTGAVQSLSEGLADRSNFSLMLGPWQHGYPYDPTGNSGNLLLSPVQPPAEPEDRESKKGTSVLTLGVYLAWFDRWLRHNTQAPVYPKAMVWESPDRTGERWRGFDVWPPASATATRLHMTRDGLRRMSSTDQKPMRYQAAGGSLTFDTGRLPRDTILSGSTDLHLKAAFSGTDGVVIGALFDVAPDGTATELAPPSFASNGRGYLRASHRESHSSPTPVIPGKVYNLRFTIPDEFWRFGAGHRLRLQISSSDPGVEPTTGAPTGTVTITPGRRSFIEARLADPEAVLAEGRQSTSAPANRRLTVLDRTLTATVPRTGRARTTLRVGCVSGGRACTGTAYVRLGGRDLASTEVQVPRGTKRRVKVWIPRRATQTLRNGRRVVLRVSFVGTGKTRSSGPIRVAVRR